MKIFITLLFFVFVTVSGVHPGDRLVYIEAFTSSTCGACASLNPAFNNWFATQNPEEVLRVYYHMNWPPPGNDPMYHHNSADNNARRSFYGVNAIPNGFMDGTTEIEYSGSWLAANLNSRKNILSPIAITVLDSVQGDSVKVTAVIYCEQMMSSPLVTVYMNVIETLITNTNPPPTNGETEFPHVMRKMLPSSSGRQVLLKPGNTVILEERFKMHPDWDPSKIVVHVWAQAPDKEVLNVATSISSYSLIPDPGYRIVELGQAGSESFNINIPYFAEGYNSPVQFSAEVEPANNNINVSFPSGNTISSFPGSVTMNVSSGAQVPAGLYKIIVTGTNSINRPRKIVVNYLVGKNFVEIGTNKGGIPFTINGSSFTMSQLYAWDIGSQQNLEAPLTHTVGNVKHVFENWNNGVTTNQQTITVNSSTGNYTANYKTQFKILSAVNPGGIPANIVNGNMFHDSGSSVTVSIEPTQVQYNGKTYYFNRWYGSGEGSYNGTNPSFTVNLSNPINQIAIFDTVNVGIATLGSEVPDKFFLYQNYPNPFNPVTKIKFDIAKYGNVSLKVYNVLGEEVAILQNGNMLPGRYEYSFDASGLSSGIYFYKLTSNEFVSIRRFVILK